MRDYTITEAAKKLGIKRDTVSWWVKSGKMKAIKGNKPKSPYKIPESEVAKFDRKAKAAISEEIKESRSEMTKTDASPCRQNRQEIGGNCNCRCDEVAEAQHILLETMHHVAITQEKIASILAELAKKK